MAVEGINTKTWRQWGDLIHTSEVFIPPQSALVTSALVGTIDDGRSWCGIVEVRTRPILERTGKILHVHESAALEGAEIPDDRVLEKRAVELAQRLSGDRLGAVASHLSVLTVAASAVDESTRMKVDVKKRTLVTMPETPPRKRAVKRPALRQTKSKVKAKSATRRQKRS